jgi:hypothetical protein
MAQCKTQNQEDSQYSLRFSQDLNPAPPNYKSRALNLRCTSVVPDDRPLQSQPLRVASTTYRFACVQIVLLVFLSSRTSRLVREQSSEKGWGRNCLLARVTATLLFNHPPLPVFTRR